MWVALEAKKNKTPVARGDYPSRRVAPNHTEKEETVDRTADRMTAVPEAPAASGHPGWTGPHVSSGHQKDFIEVQKGKTPSLPGKSGQETREDVPGRAVADAYPLYRENMPPVYPALARSRGYEGTVLVVAEILPDGRVGKMKIRKSSGYAVLDQSAVEAVRPWKFEPARKAGKPCVVWVELPIKFILRDDNSQS